MYVVTRRNLIYFRRLITLPSLGALRAYTHEQETQGSLERLVEMEDEVGPLQSHHKVSGSEAGAYLRLIDACITLLEARGPSWTCNETQEEEEMGASSWPLAESSQGIDWKRARRVGISSTVFGVHRVLGVRTRLSQDG